jgi:hypothetical protein
MRYPQEQRDAVAYANAGESEVSTSTLTDACASFS